MTKLNSPPNNKYLELSEEEVAKVKATRARHKAQNPKITPEAMKIAEFGYYYGFEGVRAILSNEITLSQVNTLLLAARKVWASQLLDNMNGQFIANASSRAKKPYNTYEKAIKPIRERAKN